MNKNCMHEYIYLYRMLPGAILEFYNSVTMNLTHNIRKNKVNVDLEFYFYCIFMMEISMVAMVILLLSN